MLPKLIFSLAGASGFLAVALGAFGAHLLKGRLSETMLAAWQTGVIYQFVHTLALLAVGLLLLQAGKQTLLTVAAWAFVAGILLFSGSLYLMSLTGMKWLGPVTPIGGLCFLLGWLAFSVGAWQKLSIP